MEPRDLVSQEAAARGADPRVVLAVGTVESNLRPDAVGDNGCSYGIFQENICGGAGSTVLDAGGTIADLMDPISSTDRFAARYADAKRSLGDGASPGTIAAAAQRPADPVGYAAKIDALLGSSPSPSPSPSPTKTCKPGSKLINGVCFTAGGFGPAEDLITNPVPVIPGAPNGGGFIPHASPIDLPGAIDALRQGATQFAIAAAVLGVGAILIYSGARKTLG